MFRIKRLICVFFMFVLAASSVLSVSAINIGFELEDTPEESKNHRMDSLELTLLENEPAKRTIECFDVSKNELIAVGSSLSTEKVISVYDSEGVYKYGFKLKKDGGYYIRWDEDNILIYFVRGEYIISVDSTGEVEEMMDVSDYKAASKYWDEIDFLRKTVGDSEYLMRNNIGPLNIFALMSYSQVAVKDTSGNIKVIYDANAEQLFKVITGIVIVLLIGGVLITVFVKASVNHKSKPHSEEENQQYFCENK